MKNEKVVIIVEPKVDNMNYYKAFKKILNDKLVNDIVVAFYDSDKSKICAEIKSVEMGNKEPKRILILNENSSYDSVSAALNWVVKSRADDKQRKLVEGPRPISLQAAY